MKQVVFTIYLLSIFLSGNSQNLKKLNVDFTNIDQMKLSVRVEKSNFDLSQIKDWMLSQKDEVILKAINRKQKLAILKGNSLICLSKHKSAFQTKMYYTISLQSDRQSLVIEVKDIYYKSLPKYGKQGEPVILSYPSDWFSAKKLYKKSGKERYLNATVKNNTIEKMQTIVGDLLTHLN